MKEKEFINNLKIKKASVTFDFMWTAMAANICGYF